MRRISIAFSTAALLLLSAAAHAPTNFRALASAVIDGRVVAYSATQGRVAAVVRYQVEGTGEGCDVVFLDEKGKRVDSFAVHDAQDDAARATEKVVPNLASRLQAGAYVALDKSAWPADAPDLLVPAVGIKLKWKRNQILAVSAVGKSIPLKKVEVLAPFRAAPVAVYAAAGVPVLVVAVEQNPGEAYLEGYNVVTEMYLVRIPESPPPPARGERLPAGQPADPR